MPNDTTLKRSEAKLDDLAPEVTGPAGVCRLCDISQAMLYRLLAQEKFPAPTKIGTEKTVWRIAEIRYWLAAGCPDRANWEAMKAAKKR
jgi:predicted DNA-binding transcriptional regulator AlpA